MLPEKSLPKPGTTRSPRNDGPANAANQKNLPTPGTTCLPTCPPSTARLANAATYQYFPKLGTTCLTTLPPSNDGPSYVATQTSLPNTQKSFPKTSMMCSPMCPPINTNPDNTATQKYLPNTGTTRLPSSATLDTKTANIPQHWSDYTTEVIGQAETMEARQKLGEEIMGDAAKKHVKIRGLVAPQWRAKMHPAAPLLTKYSTTGCPVKVGQD